MVDLNAMLKKTKEKVDENLKRTINSANEKTVSGAGNSKAKSGFLAGLGKGANGADKEEGKTIAPADQKASSSGFKLNLAKPARVSDAPAQSGSMLPPENTATPAADALVIDVAEASAVSVDAATYNHPSQPDGLTAEAAKQFKDALEVIKNSFDQKELVGAAIQHALLILKKNEQFKTILMPEDVGLMVRALRQSYGYALTSKTERKEKKRATAKSVDEATQLLKDINFDLGGA